MTRESSASQNAAGRSRVAAMTIAAFGSLQPDRHQQLIVKPVLPLHGERLDAVRRESDALVALSRDVVSFDDAKLHRCEILSARPLDAGAEQLLADGAAPIDRAHVDAPDGRRVRE